MAAAPQTEFKPLSKQEVVGVLDNIPVFNLVNSEQQLFPVKDEKGDVAVRWFADLEEAKSALVVVQHMNPDIPLKLGVTPMGTAFALTQKWAENGSKYPLRLQASRRIIAAVADELGAQVDGDNIFPLFHCDTISSSRVLPLFLTKADFAATWASAGRPESYLPTVLEVTDLHAIVRKMLTDTDFNWRTVMFIASESATKMAHQIQEEEAAASKPVDPLDEPPPLESDD